MTVAAIIPRNDYIGTGLVDTYAYTFKIVDQTDLLVIVADTLGVETVMTLGVDYTVTDVGNINGGTIVFSGNLAEDYALTILQNAPVEQETSIRNDSQYYASIHEDTFDTGRRIDQQLNEALLRTLQFKRTSLTTGVYINDIEADSVLLSSSDASEVTWAPRASFLGPTGPQGPPGTGLIDSISDTATINLTDTAGDLTADIVALSIDNSLISTTAAIALSKLAATTASRVLVSDGSGFVSPSSITSTTLAFLDATSSVQTQLDAKLNLSGGTMSGAIAMGTNKITGAGNPSDPQDVATKAYVDAATPSILTNSTFTGTTITAGSGPIQKFRYTGVSAQALSALDFSAMPDGARIIITGSSNTNTITISLGLTNVQINGEWIGYQYSTIELVKDDTQLIEVSRNGI